MNLNESLNTGDLKPIDYDKKVEKLERALTNLCENRTFKLCLDDRHFFLWSKRLGRKYRLLIAITDYDTDKYRYYTLTDADYYLLEMFYDRFLEFFAKYCEYVELDPHFLW